MTQATLVDGLGQLHTRVYASTADLPTPFLGAMAIVDGGVGGDLYISLHDTTGTLVWVAWTPLYNAIQAIATETNNLITSDDPLATGLGIDVVGNALTLSSPLYGLQIFQIGATPTSPPLRIIRINQTDDQALLTFIPDDATAVAAVNGFAEISTRGYGPDLPAATTDHLGAIVRLIAGSPGTDTFWYCGLQDGIPTWLSLQGPEGPAGPTGPAPVFGDPTAAGLPYGDDPTVTQTGSGTEGDPYIDHFGIPAGAPGSAAVLSFPALPGYGEPPVSFTCIVPASGLVLPWEIPNGYSIQVSEITGLWGVIPIVDFEAYGPAGTSGTNNGFNNGQLVGVLFSGTTSGSETYVEYFDPVASALTMTEDFNWVLIWQNPFFAAPPVVGYLVATITVTAPSEAGWSSTVDFTTGEHGFAPVVESGNGPTGEYVSGTGFEGIGFVSGGFPYKGVYITLTVDSCTLTSIEMFGTATFSNSNPANAMIGAGGSSFEAYDTGATMPADGAIDWVWDGVISHPSNPSSPQSGQTQIVLFIYSSDHDETSGASLITSVLIHGTGTKPSQLP